MNIPETLITNDKKAINDFIGNDHLAGVVYKTFFPARWEENNKIYGCYSTLITEEMLPDEESISLTPGLYQKAVLKKYEVRVTFFGTECIAVKIHNSEEMDWRTLFSSCSLKISPISIPLEIENKCIALMSRLGIVFGCFDFIVTPSDEYVFLEVNEMGQFLWIENLLPDLHLLNKFCEFLIFNASNNDLSFSQKEPLKLKEIRSTLSYQNLKDEDLKVDEGRFV